MAIDYSKLSDFEINQAVAEIMFPGLSFRRLHDNHECAWHKDCRNNKFIRVNYCNSPNDAWPIIAQNKIDIDWGENTDVEVFGHVSANLYGSDGRMISHDVNTERHSALRAAMIVFLMMQEASNAKSA